MKKKQVFLSIILLLSGACCLAQQEWKPVVNVQFPGGHVYKLYADSTDDLLYIGGTPLSLGGGNYMANLITYDGVTLDSSIQSGMNECWNLGCIGTFDYTRFKNEIYCSSVRSATDSLGPPIIGIGRWNGEKWSRLGAGIKNVDTTNENVGLAYDLLATDSMLYVAGTFEFVDNQPMKSIAAWDGEHWHPVGPPLEGTYPEHVPLAFAVAEYQGEVYLSGNLSVVLDGVFQQSLIKFDGTKWKEVIPPANLSGWITVSAMEVFQGKLYLGGYFWEEGGAYGNCIMSWDGTQWSNVGGGLCGGSGKIDRFGVYDNKLYAVGRFECIGGIPAHSIAAWDGEKWCSVGRSTFDRAIHAVAVYHDTVYIGGSFEHINDEPVYLLARFVGDHSTDTCSTAVSATYTPAQPVARLQVVPNPASSFVSVQLPTNTSEIVDVHMYNVLGREVNADLHWNPGASQIQAGVQNFPAGLYRVAVVFKNGRIGVASFQKM